MESALKYHLVCFHMRLCHYKGHIVAYLIHHDSFALPIQRGQSYAATAAAPSVTLLNEPLSN